ncbi:hypothetical protein [Micromonospora chokoriensis]|uniref:Uncharacterized protein n=1 Tax=Micromonospora chokoriensis TaxID=356851 RepID=A0A1C4Y659_9ACTN|nr:hypothetical protein [Micromonospora chokoriensis]SCF16203.1 hypothetical protein GA0070612_4336 [Micromonospora chokoriensis]
MHCPVSGTASTPAPRHKALLSPDQIRTLARRWALILAAVGAGVVVAFLLQDPAAAHGRRDGSGGERGQQAGVLVERVVRLGLGEAPERRRQQVTAVVDGRPDAPTRASRVVSPADVRPPVASPRPDARSFRSAPLPRVDQDAVRQAKRPSETAVGVRHRPVGTSGKAPNGVDVVGDPRVAVLPVVTSTVGLVADRSSRVVHAVLGPTVGPVVVVLDRVVDVALGEVVVAASPRIPAPAPVPAPERPAPGVAPVAVSDAAGQAVSASPVRPTVVPVRVFEPPAAEVFAGGAVSAAASAGRGAGWSGLTPAGVGGRVWPVAPAGPVAPVDQDAVGAGDRSPPGPGSGCAVARPSPTCSERVFDVVPLVVAAGFPSVSARPG